MNGNSRDFFERMYRAREDPWSFASSEYEQRRYGTLLDYIPHGRFRRAFEPGCSIGEFTFKLATRCGFVTAIDISETAVERTRRRCRLLANVDAYQGSLPDDIPAGPFDLVVFSEIGYYFEESQLIDLTAEIASRIDHGGQLLAAHWTGLSPDHLLGGRQVHRILRDHLPMEHLHHESHSSDDHDGFVLDSWRLPARPNAKPQ